MIVFVFSTYPTRASARKVGKSAVEKRLAGCVLTMPVGSIYRWKGKMEDTKEALAVFKTTKGKAVRLMKFIETHHPYEVPFVALLPLKDVNKKYQQWLEHELGNG
ncbi:hypothetical protein A3J43_00255 [Candidatus Uhrbacteria bacterium RIFCSPHIGHO2_12_FULL_54_23]|uniref:Cation tolerance protein CutA n=3 Tax=Candidatus Uhriibacteriota TaxID=1752732 RepID=A0A1F7UFP2_9BACT|nr:MAG: hypothetical protein A3J43_00255 [Candidatus Uhrbacteria bacterium RIFCSPHIGHO2_12_FULL_54_23]OGL85519.1 MAG: hypothetical protein A3B36_00895 [Candidatus Uhrbacteria bacterium RIFCSPLOWO2_01_FULL_55_36]OGL89650.1 MAG: hypothetical protein A3J36_02120 [Candidatus Uhrbacteria bacterium RIFCSPLOWO2_02_FULL_54_37]